MTTRGATRRRSPSGRARRRVQWENSRLGITTLGPVATNNTNLSIPRGVSERKGLTLARVIGKVTTSNLTTGTTQDWTAGISLNEGTSLGPTDDQVPWIWWTGGVTRNDDTSDLDLVNVKGMRKMDADSQITFSIRNNDATQSMQYHLALRLLFMLP